jgi:hypothetical protein
MLFLNRTPTRSIDNITPYEAWHKRKPPTTTYSH